MKADAVDATKKDIAHLESLCGELADMHNAVERYSEQVHNIVPSSSLEVQVQKDAILASLRSWMGLVTVAKATLARTVAEHEK